MRTVKFRRLFDEANAARVQFDLERNQVVKFVVQLECRFNDEWMPVVRYDTAHNYAHRDVLYPSGESEKTATTIVDFNEALTFAILDLNQNWQKYRERYEQWLEK